MTRWCARPPTDSLACACSPRAYVPARARPLAAPLTPRALWCRSWSGALSRCRPTTVGITTSTNSIATLHLSLSLYQNGRA